MDDIEYNRQMEYDMMMNELLSMGEGIDEYQKEMNYDLIGDVFPDTDVDIKKLIIVNEDANDNKSNNKNNVLRYAVPTDEKYMKNKQLNYVPIIVPLPYSKYKQGEDHRYLYENILYKNRDEIEFLTKRKIETIIKNLRKTSRMDSPLEAKEINGEIAYILNYKNEQGRKYVLIEEDILKSLFSASNHNKIKMYLILKYRCSTEKFTRITRKSLASAMGLNTNSENTLTRIGTILKSLAKEKYIEIMEKYDNQIDEKGKITYSRNKYIRLCTYEEWLKYDQEIIKKG